MKIACIGGGPAGLYFAILMKGARPDCEVIVFERNRPEDTFGFGVVFSDATLENIASADVEVFRVMKSALFHWDDIDIHTQGQRLRSTGHGFCGMSRHTLLRILQERARDLGVQVRYEHPIHDLAEVGAADLIVVADGVNSVHRERGSSQFGTQIDWRPNRFIWLGTTLPLTAFTFFFRQNDAGLWRVHAYRYNETHSTFIVETTEQSWRAAGLDTASEDESVAYCERLFAEELRGHPLMKNRSIWRQFPTIKNERWHHGRHVLMGDAAHTAHFSIGSGTKLAMEDAIALRKALLEHPDLDSALDAYELDRRAAVDATQRAAQVSLQWFEETERYFGTLEPLQLAFSLLTRSLRITHANLQMRDPEFMRQLDEWVTQKAEIQVGHAIERQLLPAHPSGRSSRRAPPPMFTPFRLRGLELSNRVVVSPMCMYSATEGAVNDWHLVHLGSRAVGGAGLVIAEMTDVCAEGRITPGCAGLYDTSHLPAWKRVVDFVHGWTRSAIGIQLAHAGRKGATCRPWEGPDRPLATGAWPLIAPSSLPYLPGSQVPREMTRQDMDHLIGDFARSAALADAAGFDLLEVHFAHGYLLGSFLSPLTNRRTDLYGGSIENRMRFPLEVFQAVRSVWPESKPVSVRISATDWVQGGFTPEDSVRVALALKALQCDIIDVSAGQTVPDQAPVYGRLFQTPFSDRVRLEARIPTMTVGNISSYSDVNSIIAAGRADLCVLARAHLYDPYWTRHAAHEQSWPLEWPDQYRSISRFNPRFSQS